jgi:hypothetical protein
MKNNLIAKVDGHIRCVNEQGTVLIDKHNAVHPQNLARVFARGLSNENNYFISRMAFGNGGTQTDAAYTITYNTPNDGQDPDVNTWDSSLYNETYSEIIDEGNVTPNPLLGTDPGSSGTSGTRPGGGSVPSFDPVSAPHISGPGVRSVELGLTSQVIITVVLNPNEPLGQFENNNLSPEEYTESAFTFDEIALYTSGAPSASTSGSADINVNNKTSMSDTTLTANTTYDFKIEVDGGTTTTITFTTPSSGGSGIGGQILYGDLCEALNTGDISWNISNPLPLGAKLMITDTTVAFPSITGSQTYGFLRFMSSTTGVDSKIRLFTGDVNDLFTAIGGTPIIGVEAGTYIDGKNAGAQNNPVNPSEERERLLAHVIFSPVLKAANSTYTITYTLTIAVAKTE